ncbi:MAG: hypothetical protein M3277_02805 [Actinomycetota bacterium]|nr:hypothetical protein [Actinomycetota bacterium]
MAVLGVVLIGLLFTPHVRPLFSGSGPEPATLARAAVGSSAPEQTAPAGAEQKEPTIYDDPVREANDCLGAPPQSEITNNELELVARDPSVKRIASIVSAIRGLDFKRPPSVRFKSASSVADEVRQLAHKSDPDLRNLGTLLKELRLIPRETDLRSLILDVLPEKVDAFYRPGTKSILAPRDRSLMSPYEQVVLAHELTHALVDQHLPLPRHPKGSTQTSEEQGAALALIEGDATLVMTNYLTFALTAEARQEFQQAATHRSDTSGSLPNFLAKSTAFPYAEGSLFVCYLWNRGGHAALDAAYEDPPRTTAEIVFPQRFIDGTQKKTVDPVDPRLSGWEHADKFEVGVADLLFMIDTVMPGELPHGVVDIEDLGRWNGGELHLFRRGNSAAVALNLVETNRTIPDTISLCNLMQVWYAESKWQPGTEDGGLPQHHGRTSEGRYTRLECDGRQVRFAIGPSKDTVHKLLR